MEHLTFKILFKTANKFDLLLDHLLLCRAKKLLKHFPL
jgi:hypothetical protein